MRILIVTQYFWPEDFRINDLAVGLRERGHEVIVYTGKPNYPQGRFFQGYGFFRGANDSYRDIRIIRVPLIPRGDAGAYRLGLNYASFALFATALAPFRVPGRFDAILVYEPSPVTVGLPAVLLKKLKAAPLLFWVQDLWPESLSATGAVREAWILKAVEHLVRFLYRRCDLILVQSRAFIEPVRAFGISADRIAYFPNSAEAFYRPVTVETEATERAKLPDGFRVMFAGNIGVAQDFETIIAAAERLKPFPDIRWIIVGDGRMLSWVEAEVARRSLQASVFLLGRYPPASMPRWFALADVMLVTLREDPIFAMTIPAKAQSYFACARPIVAALDGEGARVIREAGAGITVAPGNAAALAEAVMALYRMPEPERHAMGERGRRYFEQHFERERLLGQLEKWMDECAGAGGPCAS
ncbi:MAG TPA: glycosyltransferase family 4 protein [Burkholderiales bacterium]|nr:glycosyltransferase family 4 protein [Burkholderiales bacterium]